MQKKHSTFVSKKLPELFEYLNEFDRKMFEKVTEAEKLMRSRDYDAVRRKLREIKEML